MRVLKLLTFGILLGGALSAEGQELSGLLGPEAEARLAEAFAPELVYHPDEEYFPSDPLFPLVGAAPSTREELLELLGTPAERSEAYRRLGLSGKSELARVFYRAYPAYPDGNPRIVLEYWLYYVWNEYSVRGNLLPLWFDGDHPNDLEHIHLVLRPDSTADSFRIETAYASSHDGHVPIHQARPGPESSRHLRFLVERGAHALAPDLNEDGFYTPGVDGDSGYKLVWGIRDRGLTWPRYSPRFMDRREPGSAIVLAYDPSGGSAEVPYRLSPVRELEAAFAQLSLTDEEREAAFEDERHWLRRLFGGDNGSSETLLMPPPPRANTESVGIRPYSSRERGLMLGTTLSLEEPGLLLGGRYAFLNRWRWIPDLVLEAEGLLTKDDAYLSSRLLASYPIDGSTRFMAGRGLITDSPGFARRQWDWVGTIEFTLGRMRVSATGRSIGPVSGLSKEFRLFYLF